MSDVSKAELWQLVNAFDELTKSTDPHNPSAGYVGESPSMSPPPPNNALRAVWRGAQASHNNSTAAASNNVSGVSTVSGDYLTNVESLVNQFFAKSAQRASQQLHDEAAAHQHHGSPQHDTASTLHSWGGSQDRDAPLPHALGLQPHRDASPASMNYDRDLEGGLETFENPSVMRFTVREPLRVFDRTAEWQRRHDAMLNNLRVVREQEQLQECTFTPAISDGSHKIRGSHMERERTRAVSSGKRRQQRQKELADEEVSECTFHPAVNTEYATANKDADGSAARHHRYLDVSTASHDARRCDKHKPTPDDVECTFTPRVHKLNTTSTSSMYASTDVFTRLYSNAERLHHERSRTRGAHDETGDNSMTMDASSMCAPHAATIQSMLREMNVLDKLAPTSSVPSLRTSDWMGLEAAEYRYVDSDEEDSTVRIDFNEFLQRQNRKELDKAAHLRKITEETKPTHRPNLCPASLEKYKAHRERVQQMERRKQELERQRQQQNVSTDSHHSSNNNADPNNSSGAGDENERPQQPKIRIDPTKMSDDVMRRRHAKLQVLREALAKKEMQDATFQPRTTKYASEVSSTLDQSRLENYIEHTQRQQREKMQRSEIIQRRQAESETNGCTFKPKRTPVPAYISRMAASMQHVREYVANSQHPPQQQATSRLSGAGGQYAR
eukprot:PhM_4_TR17517/c0_g1_i1/m.51083